MKNKLIILTILVGIIGFIIPISFSKYYDSSKFTVVSHVPAKKSPVHSIQDLISNANSGSITDYEDGDKQEMYTFTHPATAQTPAWTDYRFIGDEPDNYVYFNCTDDSDTSTCELWRIIGVFNVIDSNNQEVQMLKIVRNSPLSDSKRFDIYTSNDWSASSLKDFLNNDYYNQLSLTAKTMIASAKYYLGGNDGVEYSAPEIYSWERGTNVYPGNQTNWEGKVGLIYPSDYFYTFANGVYDSCYYNSGDCDNAELSWMFLSDYNGWLISPKSDISFRSYTINYTLGYANSVSEYYNQVRPTVYLSNYVLIDGGNGKIGNPYVLSLNKNFKDHILSLANDYQDSSSNEIMYSNGNTHEMYTFTHPATTQTPAWTDYRYIGNVPNNYVNFNCDNDRTNCELWRIIGVFNVDDGNGNIEQRVKLVRAYSLPGGMCWDDNTDGTYKNDWTDTNARLKNYLNGDYYNRTGDAENFGLKESAQNMIGDAKYYLGALQYNSSTIFGSANDIYSSERGNVSCGACNGLTSKLSWTGKISVIYGSDEYMVYGKGVDNNCFNSPYRCNPSATPAGAPSTGWLYNSNMYIDQLTIRYTWLLNSYAGATDRVFMVYVEGLLDTNGLAGYLVVRPTVYLKEDVKVVDGNGEVGNPYVITY